MPDLHMRTCLLSAALVAAPSVMAQHGAMAQQGLGDQPELSSARPSIFEVSGRTQQFLSAEAIGLPQGGTFVMDQLWLRYDGPSQTTAGTPHVLQNLTIRVGASNRSPNQAGTVFDNNLSKPLTVAFTASNYAIPIDPLPSEVTEPWGASGGELHFPFAQPLAIEVPATGSLVIEFAVDVAPSHAAGDTQLDFHEIPMLGHLGTSIGEGVSCGYPSAGPVVLTEGDYDIGTSFRISGANFTPHMPVATWATALLTPPALLPGSFCWSYLDLNTGLLVQVNLTDAFGSFNGDPPFPIPPAPGLAGAVLYLQSAGLTQQSPMNTAGIETSNYRTIRVGNRSPEPLPGWYVTRPGSSSAAIGSTSKGGFLALRFQ